MSYQIVCLSCGYHRTWSTLADTRADGHRHHNAPCAGPALRAPLQPTRGDTGGDGATKASNRGSLPPAGPMVDLGPLGA